MTEILTPTEFSSWYDENFDGKETIRKCTRPILSGLFAKDKFPLLSRVISEFHKRRYYGEKDRMKREITLGDKFRESETYRLHYNTYISEIIDFLKSFAPENIVVSDTTPDDSTEPFTLGKVYLEIGTTARPSQYIGLGSRAKGAPSESQIELLFITDELDDDQYGPQISFFGASFNPNKYFTKDVYGKLNSSRSAFDSYLSDNEEENTHVLNHVFELTYDSYVALVKHLNKPSRVSLNYPGGIR